MRTDYVPLEGALPAVETVLYTAPAGTRVRWRSLCVKNTDVVARNTFIYIRASGAVSIRLLEFSLAPGYSVWFAEDELPVLVEGNTVRGMAAAANVVEYVMSFIEEHPV